MDIIESVRARLPRPIACAITGGPDCPPSGWGALGALGVRPQSEVTGPNNRGRFAYAPFDEATRRRMIRDNPELKGSLRPA